MRTVALRPTRKPIGKTPVGSIVHVAPHVAKALLALGLAEQGPAEAGQRKDKPKPKAKPKAKPQRPYRRRDMQAEE